MKNEMKSEKFKLYYTERIEMKEDNFFVKIYKILIVIIKYFIRKIYGTLAKK